MKKHVEVGHSQNNENECQVVRGQNNERAYSSGACANNLEVDLFDLFQDRDREQIVRR